MEFSRRGFLGAGAAAGAGLLLGEAPEADARRRRKRKRKRRRKSRKADVVVVGAGFAGLTAAREIKRAGHSVIVLESRNRVGGRALNHPLGGGEVSEAGGTFVGPTQNHILALAKELGVGTFPTYNTGENVYYAHGSRSTYSDTGPLGTAPPDPLIIAEITESVVQLDQMSTEVPVDAPWEAAKAGEWDGQTLETWIRDNSSSSRFREIVSTATRPIFGCEPRDISLLFTLFYIAASGDETHPGTFERNFNTRDGAQMFRLVGGSQVLCLEMARRLGRRRVVLRSPVRRIVQGSRGVRVESDRLTVRARQAIVAIPPTLAGRIDYRPILPADRDQLTQRYAQGTLIKVAAVYDRAFWRDKGLTGQVVSLDGPVNATFDDSPQSGKPGVMFGVVGGDHARAHRNRSPAERRRVVLDQFAAFFGSEAKSARDYFETDWTSVPWSRGCPVGIAGPGTLLAYGPSLRPPVGRIHWAGTETSGYWNGYMDGAVRSGKRAAHEALDAL